MRRIMLFVSAGFVVLYLVLGLISALHIWYPSAYASHALMLIALAALLFNTTVAAYLPPGKE